MNQEPKDFMSARSADTDFNKLIKESDDFMLITIKVDDAIYSTMGVHVKNPASLSSIITALLHENQDLKNDVMMNLLMLHERKNKTIN